MDHMLPKDALLHGFDEKFGQFHYWITSGYRGRFGSSVVWAPDCHLCERGAIPGNGMCCRPRIRLFLEDLAWAGVSDIFAGHHKRSYFLVKIMSDQKVRSEFYQGMYPWVMAKTTTHDSTCMQDYVSSVPCNFTYLPKKSWITLQVSKVIGHQMA